MRDKLKDFLFSTGFIVVVAFIVRLINLAVFYHYVALPVVRDNQQFGAEVGSVAAAIAAGRGFSTPLYYFRTGPTVWFTPIYPYLLAAIFKIYGTFTYPSSLIIRTIDIALSSFTCWPICAVGTKVFGKVTGKAAAWAWVFLPTSIYFSILWVWDTPMIGLWMAMLFAATLYLRGSDRLSWWIGYGALWGVGAMINPSILSVLPFLALWAIWPLRHRLAHASKLAAASALIFIVCVAPWSVRNYVVFHQFIPFRSNFGLELWLGNNSEGYDTSTAVELLHPGGNAVEGNKFMSMTEIPYMQEKQREALAYMRSHPADTAHAIFLRFVDNWLGMWDPIADVWATSPLYARASIVWNCVFSVSALFGALFAYRARKEAALPFAMVLLIFPIVFYISHSSLRYRFPIDPLMQVLSVYAVVYPLSQLAGRSKAFTGSRQHSMGTSLPASGDSIS